MQRHTLITATALALLTALSATAATPVSSKDDPGGTFDPARHLPLSKVKAGMKGYGLTIFSGTTVEKFDVEIVDVVTGFGPKQAVILIRATGHDLERSGIIAGMSGSPVYLQDSADGKFKLIGAVAYGWSGHVVGPPVGGVQPIEQMLMVRNNPGQNASAEATPAPGSVLREFVASLPARGVSDDVRSGRFSWVGWTAPISSTSASKPAAGATSESSGLTPLSLPISCSGLSPRLIPAATAGFAAAGMTLMPSAGVVSAGQKIGPKELVPAGVLAVPFAIGDMNLAGVGTVTEVIGNRFWGFGHSMFMQGPIDMPVAAGTIHSIIVNSRNSFKLGSSGEPFATMTSDQYAAVYGQMTAAPKLIPLKVTCHLPGGEFEYNYQLAMHRQMTAMVAAMCVASSVTAWQDLPQFHTVTYSGKLKFDGFPDLTIGNTSSDDSVYPMLMDLIGPTDLMISNQFKEVRPVAMDVDVRVTADTKSATLLQTSTDRTSYRPGEKVSVLLRLQKLRGATFTHRVEFMVPTDLADGKYRVMIGNAQTALMTDRRNNPHIYQPQNIQDMYSAMSRILSYRDGKLYVIIDDRQPGLGVGAHTLSDLPPTKLAEMQAADPELTKPAFSSRQTTIDVPFMMKGVGQLMLDVDRNAVQ